MKRYFTLLVLVSLFSACLWADDLSVKETFSLVGNVSGVPTANYRGELCNWQIYGNHRATDIITVEGSDMRCWWLQRTDVTADGCYMKTIDLEGGIKHVSFRWAQQGKEGNNTLILSVAAGTEEHADAITRDGALGGNGTTGGDIYDDDFECKTNGQLVIMNVSTGTGGNARRFWIGHITITPYLLYRNKDVTIGTKQRGYVNNGSNDLIDNTDGEGTITFSSSATAVATVDSKTGVVTPVNAGDAIITATWSEGVTTSYTLHVVDGIIAENFSTVAKLSQVNEETTWHGDLFDWRVLNIRRGADDTIGLAPRIQATALRKGTGETYLYSKNVIEGGIKHITFDWRQWASATSPLTISAYYSSSKTEWGDDVASQSVDAVKAAEAHTFSEDIDADGSAGNGYLKLAYTSGSGHVVVGTIKIAPWLYYTTKEATLDTRVSSTYTNTDLINNTATTPSYTITPANSNVTIDEDGQVSVAEDAVVNKDFKVTASWQNVSTSYTLHIKSRKSAEASYPEADVFVRADEVVDNTLTYADGYGGDITYTSNNTNVATINSDGEITLVGIGQTQISATLSQTDDYKGGIATYLLNVVYTNYESFNLNTTTSTYAKPEEHATGDQGEWYVYIGGIQTPNYFTSNAITTRAQRTNEANQGYAKSSVLHGGISALAFNYSMMFADNDIEKWDIHVYVNDRLVGQLTNESGEPLDGVNGRTLKPMPVYTISDINEPGNFVIRFENHSTIKDGVTYESGNKGRFAIDNVSWENYDSPIVLNENADNGSLLSRNNGTIVDVNTNRSLSGGYWNTLCLPFSINKSDLGAGVNVQELHSASLSGDELTVGFTSLESNELIAGTPYLVKPATDVSLTGFTSKQIVAMPSAINRDIVTMTGIFSPKELTANDKTTLFVGMPDGAGNNLYYPSADGSLKGMRAYFKVSTPSGAPIRHARFVVDAEAVATEILNTEIPAQAEKVLIDGQLFIIRDGIRYNAIGQVVE